MSSDESDVIKTPDNSTTFIPMYPSVMKFSNGVDVSIYLVNEVFVKGDVEPQLLSP